MRKLTGTGARPQPAGLPALDRHRGDGLSGWRPWRGLRRCSLLLALLAVLAWRPAMAGLTIEISSGQQGAQPIAIVPFAQDPAARLDVAAVVAEDLARSGEFAPLPRGDLLARPSEAAAVNFRDWRALGVNNLVIGKVRPEGERFLVQFQLLDVFRGSQIAGYSVPARADQLRQAAHYVADRIYEALTGVKGVFQTRIAYVTVSGAPPQRQYELQVADADGHAPQTIVRSREPLMSPAWSPDGSRIAYVSFENRQAAVYVQTLATGARQRVAAFPGINGAPAWSPDGRRLALALSRDGNPEVYVLHLADGRLDRVTRNPAIDTEPVWTPDGRSLLFTSDRGGGPQIYEIPVAGGRAQRVSFEGGYNASPDISPDGRRVAMVHRTRDGAYRIAVLDRERGTLRVVSDGRLDESPSFAPNGRMLLYATEAGGRGVLAAAAADGRVAQRLRFQSGDVREPAWSPFAVQ